MPEHGFFTQEEIDQAERKGGEALAAQMIQSNQARLQADNEWDKLKGMEEVMLYTQDELEARIQEIRQRNRTR